MTGTLTGALTSGTVAAFMGLVFCQSVAAKAADVSAFVGTIDAYQVLPAAASRWMAFTLIAVEIVLIMALMVPRSRSGGAFLAISLLGGYGAAMAVNLARGRNWIDCGCGGPAQPINRLLVLRNALLALSAVPLLVVAPSSLDLDEAILSGVSGVTFWLGLIVAEQLLANFARLQKRRSRRTS